MKTHFKYCFILLTGLLPLTHTAQENIIELSAPTDGIHEAAFCVKLYNGFRASVLDGQPFKGAINRTFAEIPQSPYAPILTNKHGDRYLDYSLPVGSTLGSGGVSSSGAYNYSIPIDVPPGTAGMQPSVSLSYNSNSGSGSAGMGWSLSATSMISRIGSNIYQDGKTRPVKLDPSDHFSLGGSRLIALEGIPGQNGTRYALESENFSEIVSHGNLDGGPKWFRVEARNGMIYEYGRTDESRLVGDLSISPNGSEAALGWYLNRVEDRLGNYMTYEYVVTDNQVLLKEIKYTNNDSENLMAYNSVRFSYSDKPDQSFTNIGGHQFNNGFIVRKIETVSEGSVVKLFSLEYKRDLTQYLVSVKEITYDDNGNEIYYNPTIFNYGVKPLEESTKVVSNGLSLGYNDKYYIDFDGDGIKEELGLKATGGELLINLNYLRGDTYYPEAGSKYDPPLAHGGTEGRAKLEYFTLLNARYKVPSSAYSQAVDLDGNGKEDIQVLRYVSAEDGTIFEGQVKGYYLNFLLSNGTHFQLLNGKTRSESIHTIHYSEDDFYLGEEYPILIPGDYNGDGKTEFLWVNETEASILSLENGQIVVSSSFLMPQLYVDLYNEIESRKNGQENDIFKFSTYSPFDFYYALPGDFNGDGITDLLFAGSKPDNVEQNTYRITTEDKLFYFQNTSSGLDRFREGRTFSFSDFDDVLLGDFNGDGMTDIFYRDKNETEYKIDYFDTNEGLFSSKIFEGNISRFTASNREHSLAAGDFNGDGKDDIINLKWENTYSKYDVYFSTGYEFLKYTSPTHNAHKFDKKSLNVQDIYGEGKQALFFVHSPYLFIEGAGHIGDHLIKFNDRTDKLQEVSNGLGNSEKIYYKYASNPEVYTRANNFEYPIIEYQGGYSVVSDYVTPDGVGGKSHNTYHYLGLRVHAEGRGLLGFKEFRSYNKTSNILSVQSSGIFDQVYVPYLRESKVTLGTELLSKTTYQMELHEFDNKRFMMYPKWQTTNNNLSNQKTAQQTTYTDFELPPTKIESYVYPAGSSTLIAHSKVENTFKTYNSITGKRQIMPRAETTKVTSNRTGESPFVRLSHSVFNADGLLTEQIDEPNKSAITTQYLYDGFGNVENTTTTSGSTEDRTLALEYESKGRFASRAENVLSHVATQTYDNKFGQIQSQIDVNDLESNYTYDGFGKVKTAVSPTGIEVSTSYLWNDDSEIPASYVVVTEGEGLPTSKVWYDELSRPIKTAAQGLNKTIYNETTYDNRGNVVSAVASHFRGEEGIETTYQYDKYDRPIAVQNDIGTTVTSYEKDGANFKTTTITPSGQTYTSTTDASGKQIKTTDDGGELTYAYLSNGSLKETRLDGALMTSMTYDDRGRQISLFDASAGLTEYTYNDLGELLTQKDANGNIYELEYDVLGRVVLRKGPDGDMVYEYVDAGDGLGQIKSVTAPNGFKTSYAYDEFSRVNEQIELVGTEEMIHQFVFDDYGRTIYAKYPSGLELEKTYDSRSFLTAVTSPSMGDIWHADKANAFGQYTSYDLGNGITTEMRYEKHGVLESIHAEGIHTLVYAFDLKNGNLNRRVDVHGNLSETFTYDVLDRLTEANVNNSATPLMMSYAANGNIESKSDVGSYSYSDTKPNAVVGITDDENLQTISREQQDITYTPFLKVESIKEGDIYAKFFYDNNYSRKRVDFSHAITRAPIKTKYYSGSYQKELYNIGTSNDEREITYISCESGLTAVHIKESTSASNEENLYFIHTDHLGSIVQLTDAEGRIVYEQNFDAWGRTRDPNTWSYNNNYQTPGNKDFSWLRGYTGHEHLQEFDLINMNGRMYDPKAARMLSPDNFVQSPFYSQNYNRYTYVYNNPLKYTDPTGNQSASASLNYEQVLKSLKDSESAQADRWLNFIDWKTSVAEKNPLEYSFVNITNAKTGRNSAQVTSAHGQLTQAGSDYLEMLRSEIKRSVTKLNTYFFGSNESRASYQTNNNNSKKHSTGDYWGDGGKIEYDGDRIAGTNFVGEGPFGSPNDSGLSPIDAIDYYAYLHDLGYFIEGVEGGIESAKFDLSVAGYDKLLVQGAMDIMKFYSERKKDPITQYRLSERTNNISKFVIAGFYHITIEKYKRLGTKPYFH